MKLNRSAAPALIFALSSSALLAQAIVPAATREEEKKEALTMEAFTVTGSNIRRLDEERALPVTVMDADDLDLRAALSPAELFDTLSIGGPIVLDEGATLGADARGDNNNINLRGIGSGNTLILLNGRRLPPHPISMAESGVPSLSTNVNILPAAAIGRVEILRDGASAIYGTDAAAGVVNSIMRRNYDRLSLSALGRMSQHGGGDEWEFGVTDGRNFNRGKSNVLIAFDHYHREMLKASDREFTRQQDLRVNHRLPPPWNGAPIRDSAGTIVIDNDFDNRLSDDSSNYGNFVRGNYDATGAFVGARPANNRGIILTSGSVNMTTSAAGVFYLIPLVDATVGFRQTLPSHNIDDFTVNWFYNHNQHTVILPKTDRSNLSVQFRHELAGKTELFGEMMAYRAYSITGRSPNSFDASTDHNLFVSADNPFNPFGTRFYEINGAPNADGTPRLAGAPAQVQIAPATGVLPRDFRPRRIIVDSNTVRFVAGLRGRVGRDWDWETGILYGRNATHDTEQNTVRESRLRAALTSADPAKAFNPFGYTFKLVPQPGNAANPFIIQVDKPYTNPAALTESLYDDFERRGRTELASWDARLSGSLYERFWGGPIGVAIGGEFRFENYKDWRPPFAGLNPATAPYNGNPNDPTNLFFGPNENDFIAVSPNVNLYASRTIGAAYTEFLLPFVGKRNRKPWARALELTLAGRAERFSDFGGTAKPKVGLLYRANEWLIFRGSAGGSFRAPNLVQTNPVPLQRSGDTFTDPYRSEVTGLNNDSNSQPVIFRQGNQALNPETSKSASGGVAISLPFYRNLTFTVDYWQIQQRDVIDDITATAQLLRDEELLDGAVQAALAAGTPIAQINLGSGTEGYVGNPKVKRAPVNPDDTTRYTTFNASRPRNQQRAPVGRVVSVVTDYVNLAGREAAGLDFGFEWRIPKTRIGSLTVRGDAAYLLQFDTEAEPGAAIVDNINRDGRTRFRGNIGGTWRRDRLTAGWFTTYYGTYVDTGASTTEQVYDALGKPEYISNYVDSGGVRRYRYLVSAYATHSAYLSYTMPRRRDARWLSDFSIRVGVNNIFDIEPPLADENYGYRRGAGTTARGRTFYTQASKRF